MIGMRVHLLICTFLALASYGAEPPPHDPAWAEDRQCFKSQTIYFGSSGSALSVEAKGKVAEVAKYVGAHPSTAVRIEGHSDDRGSAEHNLGIGDRRAEALVMNNLGTAFTRQGMDEAAECFEQALAIRREIGDLLGEAQSATNMADYYVQLKRFDEALELLNRVLEIRRQAATPYGEGVTLNNLGETFLALGRFDEAVDRLTQARQIFHDIEEIRGEGYALANLGGAYLALGHTADAIGVLERALELRQASGERFDEAHTLRDLGRAYQLAGQDERAAACLRQAAATFVDLGNLAQAAAIQAQLGESGVH